MSVSCLPHLLLSFVVACVLVLRCCEYVSFWPRTFKCIAMGSAVLFILRLRLLLYFAGSVLPSKKLYVGMVVYISWLHSCLCV